MDVNTIAAESLALLLGGVSGGVAGAAVSYFNDEKTQVRQLITEMQRVLALPEAWVLEHPAKGQCLSELNEAPATSHHNSNPWLQRVQLRYILDRSPFNTANNSPVCFHTIEGRRTYIVRDNPFLSPFNDGAAAARRANSTTVDDTHFPAYGCIVSSYGLQELCTWCHLASTIRSVASRWPFLRSGSMVQAIKPLAAALYTKERRDFLSTENWLTPSAVGFLKTLHDGPGVVWRTKG